MDDSLSYESFFKGAQKAASRAMEDHGRGEYDEFALHAGVAIERLAKAVLVKKNPAYLIEFRNGNPDMLLYLCGDLELDLDQVRTVGAKDAIKRLRRLSVLSPDPQLDLLIEIRNGAAHTSTGDKAKSHLPTLAVHIGALLRDLGLPESAFWGRWTSAIGVAVDKKRSEIQRDVEIRIKQARHLFEDRFKDLPEGTAAQVLTAAEPRVPRFDPGLNARWLTELPTGDHYFHLATVDCPACKGLATVRLLPSDRGSIPSCMDVLYCDLCSLYLTGQDEVKASGTRSPFQSNRIPRLMTITGVGPVPVLGPGPTPES
ncbi:hypothetical protein ABT185_10855 [Streptomyces clavifer]|uniref:hypothetical protein n=1 Tax=Streptomyces clavifer TaxID=68188 RepID=UPI00332AF989